MSETIKIVKSLEDESNDSVIRNTAISSGASVVGFANIKHVQEQLALTWSNVPRDLPFAVSIGIELDTQIVNKLLDINKESIANIYWEDCYRNINLKIDLITSNICSQLEHMGYKAMLIPATEKVDKEGLLGPFSHKVAARYAGIGWIGKSCMLITEKVGPRVRFGTVLTNAPFITTGSPMKEKCGKCNACVNICPVKAYSGCDFHEEDPIELRFNVRKCKTHQSESSVCSLCLAICPFGNK